MERNNTTSTGSFSRRNFLAGGAIVAGGAAAANYFAATGAQAAETGEVFQGTKPSIGRVLHNPDVCSGCRTCEIVCTVAHEGVASSELSRIQWRKDVMDACITDILTCKHCAGAECVAACPTGALHVDETTGARVIDEEVCIGCQTCLKACPVEPARIRYSADKGTCFKCDLCGGEPQCVKFCPMGALTCSWLDYTKEDGDDGFFEISLTGEARTFAHVETNTLVFAETASGYQLDGVVWTSHATQFNIIMALFDVTADFYGADGQLLGSSDNSVHIEIPEMQSAKFSLTWTTTVPLADIAHIVVNVPGEYLTNAPVEEA